MSTVHYLFPSFFYMNPQLTVQEIVLNVIATQPRVS